MTRPPLRSRLIRAAVFLVCAAAVAAVVRTIFANVGIDESYGWGPQRREQRLSFLGVFAIGFAGLLAVPGALLTIAFLRWPRPWLHRSYYTVLFMLVVAILLNVTTGAPFLVIAFCWGCDLEIWWMQTIVPATVFVAIAPLVWPVLGPHITLPVDRVAGFLRRLSESLLHEPPHGTRAPRTTLWLAVLPWLFWILAQLMIAPNGPAVGDIMFVVLPLSYAAAFYMTLIATPLLAYQLFRDARQMSRLHKVWSLAGLAAGLACYAHWVSALRMRF